MRNSKILRARQLKKYEALNAIRKVLNPKYNFTSNYENMYGDWDDLPSCAEEREKRISTIIAQLEEDLNILKVVNMSPKKEVVDTESNPSCLGAVMNRFNSELFIDNVCLSYRHDFGLLAEQDKQRIRFECREWMRGISNNWDLFKGK